jgi:HEAT repeat protein
MKRDRTQKMLDQLRAIRNSADSPEGIEALKAALNAPSNFVVAKAAEIIGQNRITDLSSQMLAAYERLFAGDPRTTDRGCEAVTAIATALYAIDFQLPEPYLRGIRHRQLEGMAPQADVATGLRSVCALALVLTPCERTIDELALLLADPEAPARLSAARAIGCTGQEACIPLLMFKVHVGDPAFEVIAECLASMLSISVPRSLDFVTELLDSSDPDRSEAAALALGSVRDARAFDALRSKWDATAFGSIRERILHAMAMSRMDQAIDFLVRLALEEPIRTAAMAVKALSLHRRDARIRELLKDAGYRRKELLPLISL